MDTMTQGDLPSRLLTIPAVADQLDCSRQHVYRLIKAGKITCVDITVDKSKSNRTKIRVRADHLENYIQNGTWALPGSG